MRIGPVVEESSINKYNDEVDDSLTSRQIRNDSDRAKHVSKNKRLLARTRVQKTDFRRTENPGAGARLDAHLDMEVPAFEDSKSARLVLS